MRWGTLLVLIGGGVLAWGSPLQYGPWTGAPGASSVAVSWAAAPASPTVVEYGPLRRGWPLNLFPLWARYLPDGHASREVAHLRLDRLQPGTWYVYRLRFPNGTQSSVGTFRTAPAPGEPVVFAVISDTQWQWEGTNRVRLVAEAMDQGPFVNHFILHGGDLVETPIPSHWEFFFTSLAPIVRWAPLFPVLGNHERDSVTYYQHFNLPQGGGRLDRRWWTLWWGDVVIVGLDTNARRPQDYLDQLDWVRESLSGSEPHKFVIFHHPVFSSDAIYGPGSEGLQSLWHPVFVELGVDIVFAGHAHNYERIERDGVTYLVVGGAGATLRPLGAQRVEGSRVANDDHLFYLLVRTDPEGIAVEVLGVARQVGEEVAPSATILDAFTLPKE